MSDPLSRLATRVAYVTRQLPRMAWYAGHLCLMRLLAEQLRHSKPRDMLKAPVRNFGRRRIDA
jgi:hypothetical protein